MQISIQEVLEQRLKAYKDNTLEVQLKIDSKEYRKKWLYGVQCFVNRVNEDRRKDDMKEVRFMEIYMKVEHIKEIDDLRWFYNQCIAYSRKKKENNFSKCFWGSLKLR